MLEPRLRDWFMQMLLSTTEPSTDSTSNHGPDLPQRHHIWAPSSDLKQSNFERILCKLGFSVDGEHVHLYKQEHGEVKWHVDRDQFTIRPRFTCIVFLNDNYEGGIICGAHNTQFHPKGGRAIVLQKSEEHWATKVTGTEMIMICDLKRY